VQNTEEKVEESAVVEIINYGFFPEVICVERGNKVSWVNRDKFEHEVVSLSHGGFESGILHFNEIFTFEFNEIGGYEYYCAIHQEETGKVVVD